jgi:hypothetical protein
LQISRREADSCFLQYIYCVFVYVVLVMASSSSSFIQLIVRKLKLKFP